MAKDTTHLSLRIDVPIKKAIEAMSIKNKRSMSAEVALLIENAAKERGFWKESEEAMAA